MAVAYTKEQSESLGNICSKHAIQVHFKGGNSIKNFLMAPNDKDTITQKSEVIYKYKCDRVECDE